VQTKHHVLWAVRLKREAAAAAAQRQRDRQATVTLHRQYRAGELPARPSDYEIPLKSNKTHFSCVPTFYIGVCSLF
jgi:hypothetical protein